MIVINCIACGIEVKAHKSTRKYCSSCVYERKKKARRKQKPLIIHCLDCDKEVEAERPTRKFCDECNIIRKRRSAHEQIDVIKKRCIEDCIYHDKKKHQNRENKKKNRKLSPIGLCAICNEFTTSCQDHNHDCCSRDDLKNIGGFKRGCGKCDRGLICRRCNWVLGACNDDTKLIESLKNYLLDWQ